MTLPRIFTSCFVLSFALSALGATDLSGKWTAGCSQLDDKNLKSELEFNGTGMIATMHRFKDGQCRNALADGVVKGHYLVSGESQAVNGAQDLDLVVEMATVTPRSAFAAWGMNAVQTCGYSDWAANVPKDVTGRNCGEGEMEIPAKGKTQFYLLKLEDEKVVLGKFTDEKNGLSTESRPDVLEDGVVFEKH